ncbi:MAG: hypothetical protein HQK51_00165 [Oligoflexia bacterium]|nr:hypothetical protein [Oligoflexia bacterium]
MFYLYIIFFILTGYFLAQTIVKKLPQHNSLSLALSPLFGSIIPFLILISLNTLHIPFSSHSLLLPWITISLILLIKERLAFKNLIKNSLSSFKAENTFTKIIFIIIVLGIIQFISHAAIMPIRAGDGHGHWGSRVVDWILNEKIQDGFFMQNPLNIIKEIVANYPLFHYLEMISSVIALPMLPAQSIKLSDLTNSLAIIFTAFFFLKFLAWKNIRAFIAATLIFFAQRGLVMFIGSGYAEVNLNYYSFLIFSLLVYAITPIHSGYSTCSSLRCSGHSWQSNNSSINISFILIGITAGVMSITKNEGLYRFIILLVPFHIFMYRRPLPIKNYIWMFAFILLFKGINKLGSPTNGNYNEYIDSIVLTSQHLKSQLPIALKAIYYSITKSDGLLKTSYLWSIPLSLIGIIYFWFSPSNWMPIIRTQLAIFYLNFMFSILPIYITLQPIVCNINDGFGLGTNVLYRLNFQSSTFLFMSLLMMGQLFLTNTNRFRFFSLDKNIVS